MHLIDMIRLDHYLLMNEVKRIQSTKKLTCLSVNIFLDNLIKHIDAENEFLHQELKKNDEFHFYFLEDEIEHEIISSNAASLRKEYRSKKDQILGGGNVLDLFKICEMLKQHISQEEYSLLPLLKNKILDNDSKRLGEKFGSYRKFMRSKVFLISQKKMNLYVENNYFTSADKFFEEDICLQH